MAAPIKPDIIRAAEKFARQLEKRELEAFEQMTQAYARIEDELEKEIEAFVRKVQMDNLTPAQAIRSKRYMELRRKLYIAQERYARFASEVISNEQQAGIEIAMREAQELAALAAPELLATEMGVVWNKLDIKSLEAFVGFASDGSPLMPAMVQRFGSMVTPAVKTTLMNGLALGWHPTKIVRKLRDTLDSRLLGNALTWARTETIRATREASRRSYEENPHIIKGWRRVAALDKRTCAACIALDGKFYPRNSDGSMPPMDDHPNGRCKMVPETATYSEILGIDVPGEPDSVWNTGEVVTGREWVERMPAGQQRAWFESQVGKGSYEAWKANRFSWDDIPKLNPSREWGDSYTVAALRDLLKRAA